MKILYTDVKQWILFILIFKSKFHRMSFRLPETSYFEIANFFKPDVASWQKGGSSLSRSGGTGTADGESSQEKDGGKGGGPGPAGMGPPGPMGGVNGAPGGVPPMVPGPVPPPYRGIMPPYVSNIIY